MVGVLVVFRRDVGGGRPLREHDRAQVVKDIVRIIRFGALAAALLRRPEELVAQSHKVHALAAARR